MRTERIETRRRRAARLTQLQAAELARIERAYHQAGCRTCGARLTAEGYCEDCTTREALHGRSAEEIDARILEIEARDRWLVARLAEWGRL